VALTRRSFLAGLGSVSVGLLFRRQLDGVLASLERDLVDEPAAPDQAPSAAEIVISPQQAFRPTRLVVATAIAPLFAIEDIVVGIASQFAPGVAIPGDLFTTVTPDAALAFGVAPAGAEIRFRVRYVGKDPRGARFTAALFGKSVDGGGTLVLPIDSGTAIVG